jgi:hypothetical protein
MATPKARVDPATEAWVKNERQIADIMSKDNVVDFLKRTVIPKFSPAQIGRNPIESTMAQLLNGSFAGEFTSNSGTNKEIVTMDLTGAIKQGEFVGKSLLSLTRNGKTIVKSSQSGTLYGFSGIGNGSAGVILEVTENERYFQLYYSSELGGFIGNNYQKRRSDSQYKKTGTVILEKQ